MSLCPEPRPRLCNAYSREASQSGIQMSCGKTRTLNDGPAQQWLCCGHNSPRGNSSVIRCLPESSSPYDDRAARLTHVDLPAPKEGGRGRPPPTGNVAGPESGSWTRWGTQSEQPHEVAFRPGVFGHLVGADVLVRPHVRRTWRTSISDTPVIHLGAFVLSVPVRQVAIE
jgi:hypothetical protein